MNASEALRIVTSKEGRVDWTQAQGLLDVIEQSLRDKANRERVDDRPKRPALDEQESRLRSCPDCDQGSSSIYCCRLTTETLFAAAETLKTLREDGAALRRAIAKARARDQLSIPEIAVDELLERLGVQP